MKFVFVVQGEGRGHMTQALALQDMLVKNGHEVVKTFIGKSPFRKIPPYFFEQSVSVVQPFSSPNFKYKKNKAINLPYTFIYNLLHAPKYIQAIRFLNREIKNLKPDVVINFYDLLCGLYYGIYNPYPKLICIGHQYFLQHPAFRFPEKHIIDRFLLNVNTQITALRAVKKLALSFYNQEDIPAGKIKVVPPLLRQEVLTLIPYEGDYMLVYMLNHGYAEELTQWHDKHPETILHVFWDKKDAPETCMLKDNLVFHRINDQKFLAYMRGARAYVSTAGFESVCEAMYLNKPVMLIPTAGHFEQKCNALDAVYAGAGIQAGCFDLSPLEAYIKKHGNINNQAFRNWVNQAEKYFIAVLEDRSI